MFASFMYSVRYGYLRPFVRIHFDQDFPHSYHILLEISDKRKLFRKHKTCVRELRDCDNNDTRSFN